MLANGVVVGRMLKANATPVGSPWMWTLAFGHHKDRTATHGYVRHARPPWQHSQKAVHLRGDGHDPLQVVAGRGVTLGFQQKARI